MVPSIPSNGNFYLAFLFPNTRLSSRYSTTAHLTFTIIAFANPHFSLSANSVSFVCDAEIYLQIRFRIPHSCLPAFCFTVNNWRASKRQLAAIIENNLIMIRTYLLFHSMGQRFLELTAFLRQLFNYPDGPFIINFLYWSLIFGHPTSSIESSFIPHDLIISQQVV